MMKWAVSILVVVTMPAWIIPAILLEGCWKLTKLVHEHLWKVRS